MNRGFLATVIATTSIVCFLCGRHFGSDLDRIRRLEDDLSQARATLASIQTQQIANASQGRLNPHAPQSRIPPVNAPAEKYGITKEDVQRTLELDAEAEKGKYSLEYDRPANRKAMEAQVKEAASQMAASNAQRYKQVFSALNVPQETQEQLLLHLSKIYEASLALEHSMDQATAARQDYDGRLRSILSDADYAKYRDFEESKHGTIEWNDMSPFFDKQGVAFDENAKSALLRAVQDNRAYSETYWHGPYDQLPEPTRGVDMTASQINRDIQALTANANALISGLTGSGLSEEQQRAVSEYYQTRIIAKQRIIAELQHPSPPPVLPFAQNPGPFE